ncbi:MAG TPA: hypothetical protein ENI90_03460 [Methylothermaceae bacterium]|nr:hypothetical protein [Methylothermaceae bacterium]
MSLYPLQRLLERIYQVELGYRVDDFLIVDSRLAALLENASTAPLREKLLVHQSDDALELSLFLEPDVVRRLRAENPLHRLHEGNLEAFLLALEGISHFLYLGWKAGQDREVSLLELELQAEVDKFVATLLLLRRQCRNCAPGPVRMRLFEHCRFAGHLEGEALQRYRHANRYAGKYCWRLEDRYLRRRQVSAMLAELQHFYRLPQRQKIRLIETA